jgi:hypothetical protein
VESLVGAGVAVAVPSSSSSLSAVLVASDESLVTVVVLESELLVDTLVADGGVSVVVPPSAYAIVGPIALKIKTTMTVDERNNVRNLFDIDPPSEDTGK